MEKTKDYYNMIFKRNSDMSRYAAIHDEISSIVGDKKVLDIGSGTGALSKKIPNYYGFDFSEEGVKITNHPNVWIGNAYERKNYVGEYDYMVCIEVLEHVDDFRVILNIPIGQKVIFSVPSFTDPAHLRVYTEDMVRERYKDYFDVSRITRFNWAGKWDKNFHDTGAYILLVEAIRI